MEIIIIASVLALYAIGYFVYYMYAKEKPRRGKQKYYDHMWP
jgi:uncharacterized membrane protein YebE (DUF533 family)